MIDGYFKRRDYTIRFWEHPFFYLILIIMLCLLISGCNDKGCCMCGSGSGCCPCPTEEAIRLIKEDGCIPSSAGSMLMCCKEYEEKHNTSLQCFY